MGWINEIKNDTNNLVTLPLAPSWRLPLSRNEGGGVERYFVTYECPGWFCRLFYFFLVSEERVPNQLKQVSIVGSKIFEALPLSASLN